MLRRELKILKYINKRGKVPESKLREKFPDIDHYYIALTETYIIVDRADFLYNPLVREELNVAKDEKIIHLSIYGIDAIDKNRHDFLMFIVPYGFTTAIAFLSLVVQFLK